MRTDRRVRSTHVSRPAGTSKSPPRTECQHVPNILCLVWAKYFGLARPQSMARCRKFAACGAPSDPSWSVVSGPPWAEHARLADRADPLEASLRPMSAHSSSSRKRWTCARGCSSSPGLGARGAADDRPSPLPVRARSAACERSTSSVLTLDPTEERNLAHPSHADEQSRALQQTMLGLLFASRHENRRSVRLLRLTRGHALQDQCAHCPPRQSSRTPPPSSIGAKWSTISSSRPA